jgi:RNA polymerase sigma-70 factor, ECF subfamily
MNSLENTDRQMKIRLDKDLSGKLTLQMLVQRYASAVLGLCFAHTKNFHDSEDIMQEVFLRAFTKIHTLRDDGKIRPWLMQIARRMCIDYHRNRPMTPAVSKDMPDHLTAEDEQIKRLHNAISKLPDGYREPIILYYLNGRNCRDVAKSLGISEDAVRKRLVRARLKLHELLSEDTK